MDFRLQNYYFSCCPPNFRVPKSDSRCTQRVHMVNFTENRALRSGIWSGNNNVGKITIKVKYLRVLYLKNKFFCKFARIISLQIKKMKILYKKPTMKVAPIEDDRPLLAASESGGFEATISGYQSDDDEESGFFQKEQE